MSCTKRYGDFTLLRRLLHQASPYWLHITGLFALHLLASLLVLLTPLPLKIVVDSVVNSLPLPGPLEVLLPAAGARSGTAVLLLAIGLLLVIALLNQVQGLGVWLLHTYTGEKMLVDFRAQLFRHVQRLSLAYHDAKGTTDAAYRIQHDAPAVQWVAISGVMPLLSSACTLAGMMYVTARIDWQLALIALAVAPVIFLVSRAYGRQLRSRWEEAKQRESSAFSVVQEVLAAVRMVKAFGQEDREQERFARHAREGVWAHLRVALAGGALDLVVGLITAAGTAAALFLGISHVQSGALTLGELLLVMGYLAQLYAPLERISKSGATLQSSLASAERAFALLDEPPDVPEKPTPRPLARAAGAVGFRDVSFAYGDNPPVLIDISLEIPAGACVGIAGKTGAGKTTLVNLLTRFYDPTAGRILLDGTDLREYKLADLRNQFTIVLQEPVLFSTTIAENIAYARPDAGAHEIIEAAKAANAHEFIIGLPQGYETLVGERGMCLSGGERQRISLARAFLKNAPILILDEPTSSVDVMTEAGILESLEQLMHGRTTWIIAHRLGTLKNCDLCLEIEHGRLVGLASAKPGGLEGRSLCPGSVLPGSGS